MPRSGTRLFEDQQDDYHMAIEVAGQPANTPKEKAYRKKAEATARDYERRFPTLSERNPATNNQINAKPKPASPKPMTQQEYETRREWLIDTAETPQDKKKLAEDLAKLDAKYKNQQKKQGTQAGHSVTKVNRKTGKSE